jgi:hypothetical protein
MPAETEPGKKIIENSTKNNFFAFQILFYSEYRFSRKKIENFLSNFFIKTNLAKLNFTEPSRSYPWPFL